MSANNRRAGRWRLAMLVLCLLALTGCLKKPSVVVLESSSTVPIYAGQQAPADGWLLSDAALVELLECCGDKLED